LGWRRPARCSADGTRAVTVGLDGLATLRDTQTWDVRKTFAWDVGRLHAAAFSPDGGTCAAGSEDGRVVVWDVIE
jgi:WD40 repeat protein